MRAKPILPLVSALALGACVAGPPPKIATPVPELPTEFFFATDVADQGSLAALLPQDDPAFAALTVAALADAPTLAEALARIDVARAGADRAGAERLPNIGADASVRATRTNPAQFGSNLPEGVSFDAEQTSYGANLTASWDPDLFGVLRARERAAMARVNAASANAVAVRNALLAEIASTVIDWRTLDARMASLTQDLEAAERLASLAGAREEAGIAPGFDRVRAEAAAAGSRSRRAALASERNRLAGRLVTLTAQPGSEVLAALALSPPQASLPEAPRAVPSTLLTNRPDVLAAAANLAAADAELASAARQRFPRLTLSGVLGLLAFDLGSLFDSDSFIYSGGGSLAAPLLDFGRIEAGIDAAAAEKRAAFAAYRGAVFTALGDAEAGYGLVAAADAEAAAAAIERDQLERAARLADTRYRAGLTDFLTVLEARRAADASGERAAAALGRAQRARIILWQALGGGENDRGPS
ncbi:efflux transporter outer membrane subunit [Altererythrobacter sp. MF3-039]|uniref:efflux transporter outer membrane subunit n=1 Tax=Altererythrobacter sp. MF3-039 TaxID=3252901 RepID=UPI00390CBCCE